MPALIIFGPPALGALGYGGYGCWETWRVVQETGDGSVVIAIPLCAVMGATWGGAVSIVVLFVWECVNMIRRRWY